jgi:hypothetical protein
MNPGRRGSAAHAAGRPTGCANTPPAEAMQFPSANPRTAHSMGKESYRVNLWY